MKTLSCMTAIWLVFFIVSASPARSQEDHTFVTSPWGPQVCLGRWIPPAAVGESGVCEGQLIGLPQLSAISARQSVERLDQLIAVLASIEQKLDVNNELVGWLIEETVKSRTLTDQQGKQVSEFLRETITQRFDALPKGLLVNGFVVKELTRLKEDILKEVEKRYPAEQTPSTK